jgi:hypothetical protein
MPVTDFLYVLMTIQLKYNKILEFIPFTKYYSDYKFKLMVDMWYVKDKTWMVSISRTHLYLSSSNTEQTILHITLENVHTQYFALLL